VTPGARGFVKPPFVPRLFRGSNAVGQPNSPLAFGTLRGFRTLLFTLASLGNNARQVWSAGQLVGSTDTLGEQLGAGQLGRACHGRMPRCIGARLLGEGLGRQRFGSGADATGISQCTLGFLAFGGERFVLRELDGCLLAGASVLASHRLEAGADAGELGDQAGEIHPRRRDWSRRLDESWLCLGRCRLEGAERLVGGVWRTGWKTLEIKHTGERCKAL
jgi:hypothetical protein